MADEAKSCARCLYTTDHPLGLTLDDDGVCSGCRVHEEKDTLDWAERYERLKAIVEPYRSAGGRNYDCIVPVTGGNDSHYIVHLVKERLGLNPLLVTYNKYFNTPLGIRNLSNLRIRFDCDILIQNVNPETVKEITRTSLRRIGSIYWPCLAGQTVFPVQTAVRYEVPLIIWGAHQGLEQVGMFSHEHEVEMSRRYRLDHDLMGISPHALPTLFDTLDEGHIWQYRYPDDAALNRVGVRGIYLGNYVRWDPKAQHEHMVATHGYKGARFARTFDTYDHVDCYNFMDVHDHIKLLKHGYSKVTDHASREIRHGRLTRQQAQNLVAKHEMAPAVHRDKFCEWLGITDRAFDFILNQHRNPRHWREVTPGQWQRIRPVSEAAAITGDVPEPLFDAQADLNFGEADRYITFGKGYPG